MNSPVFELSIENGLDLVLSETPPGDALFQIVAVPGPAWWHRGGRRVRLDGPGVWWISHPRAQDWETAPGDSLWFWVEGDGCPVPGGEATFDRALESSEPQPLPGLLPELQDLQSVATTCQYPCELRNLLVRGKGLVVVSQALHQLTSEAPRPGYDVRFFRDDLERIHQARQILLGRMTSPPTLTALAREVGLNEVKLKAGFRKLWGTTVFGLLREERLAVARRLIESGECNVSGAAYRVGYTNTSHFARNFSKRFGLSPGGLLKTVR